MRDRLIRAVYGIEFLIALVAALLFWNYVGGPTHLDYVPWYWKGILSLGVATSAVRLTAAESRGAALKWLAIVSFLVIACGLLSYYAHITEPQDQEDQGDTVVPTSLPAHFQLPRTVGQLHEHRSIFL
jgi:hypothetical protein